MAAVYTMQWTPVAESPDWQMLHDPRTQDCAVIEPELHIEIAGAGSLTFTIPPTHPDYEKIITCGILWAVSVYKNGEFLWAGHPLTLETDLYDCCTVTCEGVLGFLADAPLDSFTCKSKTITEIFTKLISGYNGQIACCRTMTIDGNTIEVMDNSFVNWRGFSPYTVTGDDENAYYTRYTGKNITAMKAVKSRLIDYFGGMLSVVPTSSTATSFWWSIDYNISTSKNICRQKLEIGKNIIALNQNIDYTDFATALVPVDSNGNEIFGYDSKEYATGTTVTKNINNTNITVVHPPSSNYFVNEDLAKQYGLIAKIYTEDAFDDTDNEAYADEVAALINSAAANLTAPTATIEVRVIDLAMIDEDEDPITLGAYVTLVKNGITTDFMVEEMTIRLDDPTQNTITLGGTVKSFTRLFL